MEARQVRWQCRRGMLELELFLLKFFEDHYEVLSKTKQQLFGDLLQESDQTLQRWLFGQSLPSNPQFLELIEAIRRNEPLA